MKGFSPRNLAYMRRFADLWPNPEILQRLLQNLPWAHLCTIMDKAAEHRDWYRETSTSPQRVQGVLAHIRGRTVGELPAQPASALDGHWMGEYQTELPPRRLLHKAIALARNRIVDTANG